MDLKIISKGFEIDLPQFLSIQMLIISWLWALLGSRFWIILEIQLLPNEFEEINLSVHFKNVERSLLELFIKSIDQQRRCWIFPFSLWNLWHTYFGALKVGYKEFFYYSKTSSKLTNRISCWSLDQPTFLVSGNNIFVYYFQLLNSVRFGDI